MGSSGGTTGTVVSGGTPLSGTTYNTNKRVPILPLETWREIIGYNPWHFWGLKNDTKVPVTSACNTVVPEYAWQNADAINRDAIRRGILLAEQRLREYLNYSTGRHFVEETIKYPSPMTGGMQYAASIGGDDRWLNIRLAEGYLRSIGVETYAAADDSVAVTLSDEDGDTLNETFTVTLTGVEGTIEQLGVYFTAADRLDGEPVSEKYRIAPVAMSLSGGTLTIKGRAYLLVKPIKYQGVGAGKGLDPDTAANLATEVAVYRRYSNPDGQTTTNAQAVLIWETEPYPKWACTDGNAPTYDPHSQDPAALAYAVARAQIRDARLGEVTIGRAAYDSDAAAWYAVDWGTCRQPDRVTIRYECGAKIDAVENTINLARLDGRWDDVIARLACAEMPRRDLGCDIANKEVYRWQFDLARSAGVNNEQYRISDADLQNPFGTAAGAVYAWQRVKHLMVTQAFLPG